MTHPQQPSWKHWVAWTCAGLLQTDIFSGALFIQMALGWNLYLSTVILLVVTAVYTIAGKKGSYWYVETVKWGRMLSLRQIQKDNNRDMQKTWDPERGSERKRCRDKWRQSCEKRELTEKDEKTVRQKKGVGSTKMKNQRQGMRETWSPAEDGLHRDKVEVQ